MKKTERGFTLLEVVVVVAISSIIIFGVFGIFQAGNEQVQVSQMKMTLEDSAREALYKMSQEIRQSSPSRITIGVNGNTIQFLVPDPANLVNADYTINWVNAHTILYALGGTNNLQLLRTDLNTNQTAVLANDVTAIQFVGNAAQPTVVTMTISVQRTLISGRLIPVTPLQMTAQAEVRNP